MNPCRIQVTGVHLHCLRSGHSEWRCGHVLCTEHSLPPQHPSALCHPWSQDGPAWEKAMVNSAKKQVQLSDATADTKAGEAPATFHEQAAEKRIVSNLPDEILSNTQPPPTQFPRSCFPPRLGEGS